MLADPLRSRQRRRRRPPKPANDRESRADREIGRTLGSRDREPRFGVEQSAARSVFADEDDVLDHRLELRRPHEMAREDVGRAAPFDERLHEGRLDAREPPFIAEREHGSRGGGDRLREAEPRAEQRRAEREHGGCSREPRSRRRPCDSTEECTHRAATRRERREDEAWTREFIGAGCSVDPGEAGRHAPCASSPEREGKEAGRRRREPAQRAQLVGASRRRSVGVRPLILCRLPVHAAIRAANLQRAETDTPIHRTSAGGIFTRGPAATSRASDRAAPRRSSTPCRSRSPRRRDRCPSRSSPRCRSRRSRPRRSRAPWRAARRAPRP